MEADKAPPQKRTSTFKISYEWSFWIIFLVGSVLVIQDRWTWNPFPLWINDPPFEGEPVVKFYDYIARISGRLALMSTNALFWTMCHSFANWFADHAPRWLEIGDIRQVHRRIHYHIAWLFLGIPILLHVWGIFIPLASESVHLEVIGERPWHIPYYQDGTIYLSDEDISKGLIQMTIIFAILLPISVLSWPRRKSWTLCNLLHLVASLWFVGSMCSGHTPHFWMFGSPFVLMYLIDRIYGYFKYRRSRAKVVKILKLDDDYLILFLQTNHTFPRTISDIYYINFPNSLLHVSHPFTMWSNYRGMKLPSDKILNPTHRGHKFSISSSDIRDVHLSVDSNGAGHVQIEMQPNSQPRPEPQPGQLSCEFVRHDTDDSLAYERALSFQSDKGILKRIMSPKGTVHYGEIQKPDGNDSERNLWDIATIVQVCRKGPDECCKAQTFTEKLSVNTVDNLKIWGPFRTIYDRLASGTGDRPVILIGSGCGAGFVLDFHCFIVANAVTLTHPVQIYFTTASIALFQFVTNMICEKKIANLSVDARITSQGDDVTYESKKNSERDMAIGRASFQEILEGCEENAEVYFCGSEKIKEEIANICSRRKLVFHKEQRFQPEICGV